MKYKGQAINISNRVNVLSLPYKKLLEPEFSGFFSKQDEKAAQALVSKYQNLKKARIVRIDGYTPRFLSEKFYALSWEELKADVMTQIAKLEDELIEGGAPFRYIYSPIYFVPLGEGWSVVDEIESLCQAAKREEE